ncbi:MAG TPA: GIY-YIG nuclease family protein [Candidatus Methanoperedens sp.]|nr:GIY-YIG nuclease family protein [Candidatus Methanoperedens sp.]
MIDLKKIPTSPGCYIYKNSKGEIIYVGKAINLKKRVSQYFRRDDALGPKTKILVSQIDSIEIKTVNSEIEALILESSLIKKYLPKYNSLLKDDRSYLYICISKESTPRIFTAHFSNLPPKANIYGPFPDASAAKSLLKTIRRLFPFRSIEKHPKSDCLYCHMGLCPGPNPDKKKYQKDIQKIKKILNGQFKSLVKSLNIEMKLASKSEEFENALTLKKQIDSLNYIVSGWYNLKILFEDINLPEDNQSSAIAELKTTLNPYLRIQKINRIEVYDISQLGNKYFVGAMVVWQDGHIDNSQYRKFKIKSKITPDDQFMIKEIIYRRLQHSEWTLPDLIVVDGGKPQVSAANSVIASEAKQSISIIGLAKRIETIVIKNDDSWIEINLPEKSHGLLLLKRLRDEAHRFANKYRQELIKKELS